MPDHIANDRQIALLVVAETVLLVLVFWVVEAAADRRSRRQWAQTTGPVIASLRLNMLLTQQRLDHAMRHTDDDITWTALAQSSEWFLRHVQTSQPLLVVHPELAGLAPKFMMIATRLADRAGALVPGQSIRNVADDPGVKAQSTMLHRAIDELAEETRRFELEYGALGEPGAP